VPAVCTLVQFTDCCMYTVQCHQPNNILQFSYFQTTGQSRPDCEIFIDMVVHHVNQDTSDKKCVVEKKKRKVSEIENYDEVANKRENTVLNKTVQENNSEKSELSR
jgi:hypothetical protein